MATQIPTRKIFVKVHNGVLSSAADRYGRVTHINDDRYRIVYANSTGDIMPPVWIDIKDCDEVPANTEIEL